MFGCVVAYRNSSDQAQWSVNSATMRPSRMALYSSGSWLGPVCAVKDASCVPPGALIANWPLMVVSAGLSIPTCSVIVPVNTNASASELVEIVFTRTSKEWLTTHHSSKPSWKACSRSCRSGLAICSSATRRLSKTRTAGGPGGGGPTFSGLTPGSVPVQPPAKNVKARIVGDRPIKRSHGRSIAICVFTLSCLSF